jgi:glucose/arabinose dehydrogenase
MKNNSSKTKSNSPKRRSWHKLTGAVTVIILLVGITAALSKQSGQAQKAPTQKAPTQKAPTQKAPTQKAPTQEAQPQKAQPQKAQIEERKSEIAQLGSRNYVTTNAAGQTVAIDRQTGQIRPLTPEEARRLAEGIKQLVNQSSEGLVEVRHANGGVEMNLQGRFQNVSLARKEADGTVTQACVNDLESAADFFEIDPALLGIAAPVSKSQSPSSKLPIR